MCVLHRLGVLSARHCLCLAAALSAQRINHFQRLYKGCQMDSIVKDNHWKL